MAPSPFLRFIIVLISFNDIQAVDFCNPGDITITPTGITNPHFHRYLRCRIHVRTINNAVLLRQFKGEDWKDWWFQGGDLHTPFSKPETLYKRLKIVPEARAFANDWFMEYTLLDTVDAYNSERDRIPVRIVQPVKTGEGYLVMESTEGGIVFRNVDSDPIARLAARLRSKFKVFNPTEGVYKAKFSPADKEHFQAYQRFLLDLKAAVDGGKPFKFPDYNGGHEGMEYVYHPAYIRHHYEDYWMIYTKRGDVIRMPLWPTITPPVALSATDDVDKLTISGGGTMDLGCGTGTTTLEGNTLTITIKDSGGSETEAISIYWEAQHRAQCGRHSVNNIIGSSRYTLTDLNGFSEALSSPTYYCFKCRGYGLSGSATHTTDETGHGGIDKCAVRRGFHRAGFYTINALRPEDESEWKPSLDKLVEYMGGSEPAWKDVQGYMSENSKHYHGYKYYHGEGNTYFKNYWIDVDSELEGPRSYAPHTTWNERQKLVIFKKDSIPVLRVQKLFLDRDELARHGIVVSEELLSLRRELQSMGFTWDAEAAVRSEAVIAVANYIDFDSDDYMNEGGNHYHPLISEYNGVSGSGSLLIGGVIGASTVVIIVLIFCLGLSFGMLVYWGYTQKKELEEKRKNTEMRWMNGDNNNEA
eukprot:278550_1